MRLTRSPGAALSRPGSTGGSWADRSGANLLRNGPRARGAAEVRWTAGASTDVGEGASRVAGVFFAAADCSTRTFATVGSATIFVSRMVGVVTGVKMSGANAVSSVTPGTDGAPAASVGSHDFRVAEARTIRSDTHVGPTRAPAPGAAPAPDVIAGPPITVAPSVSVTAPAATFAYEIREPPQRGEGWR